uniref:C-type lectin domain-containing protein n=1 Tax=Podarcis muralis TaxID=64176 RepID=A0A670ISN9_PODMU
MDGSLCPHGWLAPPPAARCASCFRSPEAACPAGWIVYEGKCYFFSEEERNWTSAQRFCISQGSSLATIQSELEKVRPTNV